MINNVACHRLEKFSSRGLCDVPYLSPEVVDLAGHEPFDVGGLRTIPRGPPVDSLARSAGTAFDAFCPVLPSFDFIGPRRLPGLPPSRSTNGFDSPVTPSHPWSTSNVECFEETFRCRESEKNSEADDCFGLIPLYRAS